MGLLDDSTGGGAQQQKVADFIGRYRQGAPADGITDQETSAHYGQVAAEVDPQTYQQSAQDALSNMSPQERQQYGQQLEAAADQQGVQHGWDGSSTDPASLAQMTTTVHQQSPGLLGGLGGGGSAGGGSAGGGGLGGMLGGAAGGGNSIMRSVLGGIAAMAASKMMNRDNTGGPGRIL